MPESRISDVPAEVPATRGARATGAEEGASEAPLGAGAGGAFQAPLGAGCGAVSTRGGADQTDVTFECRLYISFKHN